MSEIIGSMNWDACKDCKYSDELFGGCIFDVPESIEMMVLNGDYIECSHHSKKE